MRSRAGQRNAKDSNITINLTLPEGMNPHPQPQQPHLGAPPPRPCIPPQLSLEVFCERFNLTHTIRLKLLDYLVTGPHTLRHLKNEHLQEAMLNPAEIADVRDAQDRWIMGQGENID